MADYEILAQIEVLLKGQADTKRRLEDIEKGTDKVDKTLKRTGDSVDSLGKKFIALFSIAIIGNFVRRSITEFAALERGFNAIAFTLDRMGISVEENLPRVREFLESLGAEKLQDTVPAFQRLVGILGTTQGAMAGVKLAVDLSQRSGQDLGNTVQGLTQLLQGEATDAANKFGVALRDQNGEIRTNKDILEELIGVSQDFAGAQDDTSKKIDDVTASLTRFKIAVGELFGPLVGGVAIILEGIVNAARSLIPTLGAIFGSIGNILRGEGTIAIEETWLRWKESMAEIWGKGALDTAEDVAQGIDDLLDRADRKDRERREKAEKERLEKERDAAIQRAEQRAQIEQAAENALLAAQIRAAEEGSRERLELEERMLERLKEQAIQKAREVGAETLAIEEQFLIAREQLRREYEERERQHVLEELQKALDNRMNALDVMRELELTAAGENQALREALEIEALEREREYRLQNWQLTEEEKAKLTDLYEKIIANTRDFYRKQDLANEQAAKVAKINMQADIASAVLTAAGAIFGESKALAIADAIINTWRGVNLALATIPPPFGYAVAALTAAQGLANVQRIRKQDRTKGSGFDDPANDRLAYLGGRRWADDMVRNISAGFQAGLAQIQFPGPSPAQSSTTSIRHGDIVIQGPVYGGDAGLRQLRRELDQAARRDAARRVR